MRHQSVFFFLIGTFFWSNWGMAQVEPPKKILFLGNSYTYFWNLPQNVEVMAKEGGFDLQTRQTTAGGSNWGHHIRGERELKSINIMKNGDFDAVVLQNHSTSAIDRPDSLMYFGKQLSYLAKSKGAKVYLYMTWARQWDPYMQNAITAKYVELGKLINAEVVPVGLAWQKALSLRPDLPLFDEDQSHPAPLGTYLTACVFYGAFTGKSPVGLPHRLISKDGNGEKLYLNIQSEENATFCQKVAEDILNNWKD